MREQERMIEWDCIAALTRFYDLFDRWNYAGMAALYTPDGRWHRAGKELVGREAIVTELELRPKTQKVRHMLSNFLVDVVDEKHACLRSYLTVYRHENSTPNASAALIHAPSMLLLVTADFEKVSAQWLISKQLMQSESIFPEQ